ncbi:MAG: DUF2812 domain-containing protein [Clostridia bacterium]|nr:DUF2812 domain-containing protein [Clostridia bacterium]
MSKKKFTPCSVYNTEMTEYWLNLTASEGFLLEKDGYKNTYANFTESEKQKVFHRIWPKQSLKKHKWILELREEYGWEKVSTSFDFEIYRAFDDSSLRIDSDESHEKFIKKSACRRILLQIIQLLFSIIIFCLTLFIAPVLAIAENGGLFFAILVLILLLIDCIKCIKNIIMLKRISKRKENRFIDNSINFKRKTTVHQFFNMLSLVLLVISGLILSFAKFDTAVSESPPENKHDLPFATVIDFTEEKDSYALRNSILNSNENWETLVSPVNYEWNESATIKTDAGTETDCTVIIDYHETLHPLLAKYIAKMYILGAKTSDFEFKGYGDCPEFGFDYETMYYSSLEFTAYVFQDEGRIIHYQIRTDEKVSEDFNEKCAEIIADKFRK